MIRVPQVSIVSPGRVPQVRIFGPEIPSPFAAFKYPKNRDSFDEARFVTKGRVPQVRTFGPGIPSPFAAFKYPKNRDSFDEARFVTRARLQPGRTRRRKDAGFSPLKVLCIIPDRSSINRLQMWAKSKASRSSISELAQEKRPHRTIASPWIYRQHHRA